MYLESTEPHIVLVFVPHKSYTHQKKNPHILEGQYSNNHH